MSAFVASTSMSWELISEYSAALYKSIKCQAAGYLSGFVPQLESLDGRRMETRGRLLRWSYVVPTMMFDEVMQ